MANTVITAYCHNTKTDLSLPLEGWNLLATIHQIMLEDGADIEAADETLKEIYASGECDFEGPYKHTILRAMDRQTAYLPSIIYNPVENIIFPVDNVNQKIWDENITPGHNYTVNTDEKKEKEIYVYLSVYLDTQDNTTALPSSVTLFDKCIMIACAATYLAGNSYTTARNLHFIMGNSSNPNKRDIDKINESIDKLRVIGIMIDNSKEIAAGYTRPKISHRSVIVPSERTEIIINGKVVKDAIHLFRCPPLVSFARGRGQVETLPAKALQSTLSFTTYTERLRDYLLTQVSLMKSPKNCRNNKMSLRTIYEECRLTTSKQKQRAPQKIEQILNDFVRNGVITSFEIKDGTAIIKVTKRETTSTSK